MTAGRYADIALGYAARVDANPTNALYERPAMLAALRSVAGADVLDAGCGSGWYAERLLERGARVVSVDLNPDLVTAAAARLGDRAEVRQWDLARPLTFARDASFDLVLAPLVLHYLTDWAPTLAEFARVLRPGGRLLFSTHHPFMDWQTFGLPDYFATVEVEDVWDVGPVHFTRRPLRRIAGDLAAAGFVIERLDEPQPAPEMQAADPERFARLSANPWFLVVRARLAPA